jgi:hypothetical protein
VAALLDVLVEVPILARAPPSTGGAASLSCEVTRVRLQRGGGRQATNEATRLSRLQSEGSRSVRAGLVVLAAKLGHVLLPSNSWPELVALLSSAVSSPAPEARKMGLQILSELAGLLGEKTAGLAPSMEGPIIAGLGDGDAKARAAALRTLLVVLSSNVDDEVTHNLYADVFSPLMATTEACLAGSSSDGLGEETAVSVFDLLGTLLEQESPVFAPHVPVIVQAMPSVVSSPRLELLMRQAACSVI